MKNFTEETLLILILQLHELARSATVFNWTSEHENAFWKLKQSLTEALILFHPNPKSTLIPQKKKKTSMIGRANQSKVLVVQSKPVNEKSTQLKFFLVAVTFTGIFS